MKKLFLVGAALPALAALAACGDQTPTTAANDTVVMDEGFANDTFANDADPLANDADMANDTAAGPAMTPKAFADTAAASDAFEIESSKLAQQKAQSDEVKEYAAMMIRDHTQSTANLKKAASAVDVTPAPALTPEQQANLETLRSASGTGFDDAYKTQQVAAHEKTLAALQAYAANGSAAELKQFAANTAPIVDRHLEEVRGM